MTQFLLFIGFAFFVAGVFGAVANGDIKSRILYATKVFCEFVGIGLILAWIFYFLPNN
ncbi:MAG TPA: hypothetical protein VEQ34_09790 [Pyrinomonadaceae bacterium]|jgi:hypothetical protein|nr:hypothetical protein [Pyrinomonadaceae bacterium]